MVDLTIRRTRVESTTVINVVLFMLPSLMEIVTITTRLQADNWSSTSLLGRQFYLKDFVVVVDDLVDGARNSNEGDALRVGGQLDRALGGDGVTRVEDGSARK